MKSLRVNIHRFKKSLGFLIGVALIFFLLRRLSHSFQELKNSSWEFHLSWLLASFAALLLYFGLLIKPWLAFLRQLHIQLPYRQGFHLFYLSHLARYLPGSLGLLLGQVYLCHSAGIRSIEVIVSTLLQLSFLTLSGVGISLFVFWLTPPSPLPFSASILGKLPIFLWAFCLSLFILAFSTARIARFVFRKILGTDIPFAFSAFQFLRALFNNLFLWCCCGLAFFLFVRSFSPVGWNQFPAMVGIYASAWTVGFLSFITPGGLGVREGLLSLLLGAYLPPGTATFVALLSRVWMTLAELTLAAVAIALHWRKDDRRSQFFSEK